MMNIYETLEEAEAEADRTGRDRNEIRVVTGYELPSRECVGESGGEPTGRLVYSKTEILELYPPLEHRDIVVASFPTHFTCAEVLRMTIPHYTKVWILSKFMPYGAVKEFAESLDHLAPGFKELSVRAGAAIDNAYKRGDGVAELRRQVQMLDRLIRTYEC